jgi:hypothetical protein
MGPGSMGRGMRLPAAHVTMPPFPPRDFFPSCPANRRQLRLAGPIAGLFIHTRFTVEGLKVVLKGGICNMSQGGVHE